MPAAAVIGSAATILLLAADGQPAGISEADLALAILDEIEQPKRVQARFSAAD